MKENRNNLKLGIFISIGTICFIIALYILGTKQNLFGGTFELKAIFNNVNGLQKGNNVRYSGIKVGTVKEITILNDTSIEVHLRIKNDVQEFIKADAIASLGNDGLMGNKLINISPGNSNSKMVNPGDQLLSINELDADEMLRRLEETNNNVATITSSLVSVVEKIDKGEGTLGMLLNDNSMAHDLSITMANIRELSQQTAHISQHIGQSLSQVESSENTIGMLLNDTVFANEFRTTISELKSVGSNTDKVSRDLKQMLEKIQRGEGGVGTLLSDSTANENIKQSLHNLQEGSKAFHENMEALKQNFLFRRYFKKLEKENKK